jgi:hypothetical protein
MSQQTKVAIRTFQPDDLPALVDLINRAVAADQDDQFTSLEALQQRFAMPYFWPDQNCFIATLPDGHIVGYVTV